MFSVTMARRLAPKGEGGQSPQTGAISLSRFAKDERGNVAMMFGLMVFMMIGFMGASVDVGRWLLARKQTQEAIDAAVLAGLRKYQVNSNAADAITAAQANYDYSISKSGRGTPSTNPLIKSDNIAFVLQNNNTQMTATGDVIIKTPFIGLATTAFSKGASPIGTLPVLKMDGSENAITKIAQGNNAGTNIEVSVMIDITGSMGQSDNSGSTKIETVKKAATSMVDILVWDDQSSFTSKIAIVPFSENVNLGSANAANAARGTPLGGSSQTAGYQTLKFSCSGTTCSKNYTISNVCVTERLGTDKYTDVSPTTSPVGRYYSSTTSNGNGVCATVTPIQPLTSDKTKLKTLITSLSANGGTAGQLGTAWAWYMLSPNFNTLWTSANNSAWSSSNNAAPYSDLTDLTSKGRPKLRKIAVLMTDGDYNVDYCNGVQNHNSGNTYTVPTSCLTNGTSLVQATALCTAMKAKGIEVFTIGSQVSDASKTFLSACATDPSHFYDATDGTKMQQAFIDIAYKLVPPYVAH